MPTIYYRGKEHNAPAFKFKQLVTLSIKTEYLNLDVRLYNYTLMHEM